VGALRLLSQLPGKQGIPAEFHIIVSRFIEPGIVMNFLKGVTFIPS
jgi:hypothetical protein